VPRRTARLDEIGPAAIHPHDIMLFGSRQYRERDAWNRTHGEGFNWTPEPFDAESAVEWTPVWSLTRRQTRWVPTALCYFGYDLSITKGVPRFARACSNGCASGNTLEEAILQGLFELVERDAFALWWYNRVRRPAIDLASFRQPFFDEMHKVYADRDRTLHVLDLRHDLGIPAAAAVSWRTATGGEICISAGCHLDPRLAVSRALSELNQVTTFDEQIHDAPTDDREAAAAAWKREATIENQAYVVPLDDRVVEAGELEDRSSDDIADDIRFCVERLARLGYETHVLDHTRPDIGFPTARVIVPGLRHFWARLGPGRLYDVPVALGWLDRALREDELNPTPFFM
jgi:ribosomal protein S12 methylthiotransferase accessory factor